jgi:hypothetical protein
MRWAVGLVLVLAGGIVSAQPLSKPQGVAFTPSGTCLAVSDTGNNRVLIFALKGNRWHLQAIIAKLNEPHGLAWIDDERLLVCEASKGSVSAFRIVSSDVKRLFVLNGFKRPLGLTVWRNLIFVTDAEAKKVIVLDSNGRKLSEFGGNHPSSVNAPCDVSVASDGTIFVADDDGDVEIWRFELESFRAQPKEPFSLKGFWTCKSVAVVGSELWALSSYSGELRRANLSDLTKPNWRIFTGFLDGTEREVIAVHSGHRTPDGKLSRNSIFAAGKVPKVLALGRLGTPISPASDFDVAPKTGWLAIATGNRVLILPASLNLPTRPQINAAQTEATVCWETPEPSETVAEFRPADSSQWQRVSLPGRRTYHRLLLRGLTPATSYRFRILMPNCYEIVDTRSPVPSAFSFDFAFATQPPKGKTMFLRIPVAVLVYADVVNVDTLTPDAPQPPPVERAYLDYLRREVEMAQLFFWCNSHMKLWLDCDWFIVTKRITVGKNEPPQRDWRRDLESLLKLRGRSLDDYPAVVEITCERVWNPKAKRFEFAPSGGGTYGADMRPGSSHFLGGHDPAWLFVHEFHHQLDSQFAESGYPEYPFNHFAITPDGFADNFGEHYNGNAWILRHWHGGNLSLWFANKFGKIAVVDDADEDGIPDDCPAVPLDEKRFNSSPNLKDTDGDGLSDLDEVLAFTWVWEMLVWPAEINARAKYVLPDPRNPDSDGDGIPDGDDPLPIYACEPVIRRTEANEGKPWFWVEEDLTDVPRPMKVEHPAQPLKGEIFLSHNGEELRFRFVFNQPVALVHIQLDCLANGYYVGADNLDIRLRPDWDALKVAADVSVNNAGSTERWPFQDRTLMPADHVRAAVKKNEADRKFELRVAIRRTEAIGLNLGSGSQIGLAIYLQVEPNSPRWLSVFEPYRLIPLRCE